MRRIHVLGAAGAGKTSLGRAVARDLDLPHVETDDVYWLPGDPPYEHKRPVEERIALLRDVLGDSRGCVLTGSLGGWGDEVAPLLDGVVVLDTPGDVRLLRLAARQRERYGDEVAPGGALHARHVAFLEWAAAYDAGTAPGRSRARDDRWVEETALPALRLDGSASLDRLVAEMRRWTEHTDDATTLAVARDADLAAMLRGEMLAGGLRLAPGGVDHPAVLAHIRAMLARQTAAGYPDRHWAIVAGGEVVGLIGFKDAPSAQGEVEIGYGVAASRRRRGFATRAVARAIEAAAREPAIRVLTAQTHVQNAGSQRALLRNGFEAIGRRTDPEDGELVMWRRGIADAERTHG